MYNFENQQKMLEAALSLLKHHGLDHKTALGGGTALSAHYWGHRYSTDIDMFIYGSEAENNLNIIRQKNWNKEFIDQLYSLGYKDDYKNPAHYIEITIDDEKKIQFFDVLQKTTVPYVGVSLWGNDINIETVEEIIAKKIFYRADKGNARDIFDIAVAINKDPLLLTKMNIPKEKFELLFQTINTISNDEILVEKYLLNIQEMKPIDEYKIFAEKAPQYLSEYLENYISIISYGIELSENELYALEENVYNDLQIDSYIKENEKSDIESELKL
jgi:hypothetical protein